MLLAHCAQVVDALFNAEQWFVTVAFVFDDVALGVPDVFAGSEDIGPGHGVGADDGEVVSGVIGFDVDRLLAAGVGVNECDAIGAGAVEPAEVELE